MENLRIIETDNELTNVISYEANCLMTTEDELFGYRRDAGNADPSAHFGFFVLWILTVTVTLHAALGASSVSLCLPPFLTLILQIVLSVKLLRAT